MVSMPLAQVLLPVKAKKACLANREFGVSASDLEKVIILIWALAMMDLI